ncbi:pre-RNA processing PIH1/Nop17 [Novymonas esmeraldas]|uniref:Pre-RNA processing PIH1/Nop17 n=1 Tax=Novymonas esmeraldas TaxID=1808958 RepID=A0AAW0EWY8_9TRYP
MRTPSGLLVGFAFAAKTVDESSTYVVNVCGHDSVGPPLARSMEAVNSEYVEHHGVDNLILPISVSEPRKTKHREYSYCVDVVVHTMLIVKCVPHHHLFQHLTEKLVVLALEWIQSECGVKLLPRTCQRVGNPFYFADVVETPRSLAEAVKEAAELLQRKPTASDAQQGEPESHIPDALNVTRAPAPEPRQPLIREVIATPAIKRGFLVDGGARLYGPEGSGEGRGKPLDPLAHIPQSLRDKCKVIDTRDMGEFSSSVNTHASQQETATKASPTRRCCSTPPTEQRADAKGEWTRLSMQQSDGSLVCRFAVPESIVSLRDVELSATSDALEINGTVVELPVSICSDGVRAKFVKHTRTLVVTCSIDVQ